MTWSEKWLSSHGCYKHYFTSHNSPTFALLLCSLYMRCCWLSPHLSLVKVYHGVQNSVLWILLCSICLLCLFTCSREHWRTLESEIHGCSHKSDFTCGNIYFFTSDLGCHAISTFETSFISKGLKETPVLFMIYKPDNFDVYLITNMLNKFSTNRGTHSVF